MTFIATGPWGPDFISVATQPQSLVRTPARFARLRRRSAVMASDPAAPTPTTYRKSVLFVCLGNICRSPAAEALFKRTMPDSAFRVESCGTGGGNPDWYRPGGFAYHEGDSADGRMTAAASRRGITIESESRPLRPRDLLEFDWLVGMDGNNVEEIKKAARFWGEPYAEAAEKKTVRMMDFASNEKNRGMGVPDPYYGGHDGFENVLDLLEDACAGLLGAVEKSKSMR